MNELNYYHKYELRLVTLGSRLTPKKLADKGLLLPCSIQSESSILSQLSILLTHKDELSGVDTNGKNHRK